MCKGVGTFYSLVQKSQARRVLYCKGGSELGWVLNGLYGWDLFGLVRDTGGKDMS